MLADPKDAALIEARAADDANNIMLGHAKPTKDWKQFHSFVPCNALPIRQLIEKYTMLNNMYLYAVLLTYCSALTAAPACTSL
jgi:hypothetical protein